MRILSFDVGIINLAYCIWDTNTCKVVHWEVITLENCRDNSKVQINLIKSLDQRKDQLLNVDVVLIEKQPSFNPKMRIISGCLQTYFYIRGMVDQTPETQCIKEIVIFSPKHKLKCYTGPDLVIESKAKTKYSQTKKMGILIAKEKMNEFDELQTWIKFFDSHKKKDDLADCYLQAITYSMFKNKIEGSENVNTRTKARRAKVEPKKHLTKPQIKKILKDHLDPLANGNLTVMDLMYGNPNKQKLPILLDQLDNDVKNEIFTKFNFDLFNFENIEKMLDNLSMKSYINKLFVLTN